MYSKNKFLEEKSSNISLYRKFRSIDNIPLVCISYIKLRYICNVSRYPYMQLCTMHTVVPILIHNYFP